jgi:hypothetical protein
MAGVWAAAVEKTAMPKKEIAKARLPLAGFTPTSAGHIQDVEDSPRLKAGILWSYYATWPHVSNEVFCFADMCLGLRSRLGVKYLLLENSRR